MKRALLFILAFATANAQGGWQDDLSAPTPGKFPPLRPLKATYQFGWGAITAADAEFEFSRPKAGEFKLTVAARSVGMVRALWKMDAQHTAVCQVATLQPISVRQRESYKDETLTTVLDFTSEGVTRLRSSNKAQGDAPRAKKFKAPNIYDLHSALLFVRSQRLDRGEKYRFLVYPTTNPFLAEVEVIGRQKVKVAGKNQAALKLDLKLRRVSKEMKLEAHQKFKRASAWLSDDQERLILKVQADIMVGSVWTELQHVQFTSY